MVSCCGQCIIVSSIQSIAHHFSLYWHNMNMLRVQMVFINSDVVSVVALSAKNFQHVCLNIYGIG